VRSSTLPLFYRSAAILYVVLRLRLYAVPLPDRYVAVWVLESILRYVCRSTRCHVVRCSRLPTHTMPVAARIVDRCCVAARYLWIDSLPAAFRSTRAFYVAVWCAVPHHTFPQIVTRYHRSLGAVTDRSFTRYVCTRFARCVVALLPRLRVVRCVLRCTPFCCRCRTLIADIALRTFVPFPFWIGFGFCTHFPVLRSFACPLHAAICAHRCRLPSPYAFTHHAPPFAAPSAVPVLITVWIRSLRFCLLLITRTCALPALPVRVTPRAVFSTHRSRCCGSRALPLHRCCHLRVTIV